MTSPPHRMKLCKLGCFIACTLATPMAVSADPTGDAASTQGDKGAILPITGAITDVTVESLKRRIEDAREQGATVIIFDMDTPGGLVTSSIAVADLIKNLSDIKTVTWVNPDAYSGGTIIAVACDEIVMARSSRIGDSQVIMGGPTGMTAVPKELQPKAYTPVLAEFRASCRLNRYDQTLCEAFVLPDREVWWVENSETGERKFVFRAEKLKLLGEREDASADSDSETRPSESGDEDDDKSETRASESGKEDDDIETLPSGRESDTAVSQWRLVEKYHDPLLDMEVDTIQPIVRDDQLLEMSAGEAEVYGFSKGVVTDEDGLCSRYDLATVFRIKRSWSEDLAYWLTSIYVRGFLMVIILLGAYVEFHTPGVGVPGLVALICLAIFVGAPYLTGLANVWEILCLAVGVILIALELFVIPGFGIAGISGLALVLVALLATFVPDEPGRSLPLYIPAMPATLHGLKVALVTIVCSMVTSLIGMVMLSRFLPRLPLFKQLVPANPTPSEVQMNDPYRGLARVGDIGEAAGPLRPAGKARFGVALVDVVTQGEYLEPQTRVEVIERRGNHVVVRAVG